MMTTTGVVNLSKFMSFIKIINRKMVVHRAMIIDTRNL